MRTSKARQFDLLAHLAYRESSQYTTRMTSLDSVMLQTRYATGDVVYLPPASYEFTIFHNETEEIVYSQRYEPGDRDEAEDFCRQFIDVLVSQRSAKKTSALVVCASGYTAYLFAQRLGALGAGLLVRLDLLDRGVDRVEVLVQRLEVRQFLVGREAALGGGVAVRLPQRGAGLLPQFVQGLAVHTPQGVRVGHLELHVNSLMCGTLRCWLCRWAGE